MAAGIGEETPKIINIVNFIRLPEPRDSTCWKEIILRFLIQTLVRCMFPGL